MSLGLEDRLGASHLLVLKNIRNAQIDLDAIMGKSRAAYGLALWLTALADFSHHTGLMKKAKEFVPTAKRQSGAQMWQYSTNADDLNTEVLMRMPKWAAQSNLSAGQH